MHLRNRILTGLAVGAGTGIAANLLWRDAPFLNWIVDNVADPVGQIFLRMLFMVVIPLVFTSLALGVAGLGDLRRIGRIGARTLIFFVVTTVIAVATGMLIAGAVEPGSAVPEATRTALMSDYAGAAQTRIETAQTGTGFGIRTFVNIVPRNPLEAAVRGDMLAIIFFTLIFGVSLTLIPRASAEPVLKVLEGVGSAVTVMIDFAMRLAPYGVAGLLFATTARFGFDLLWSLLLYVLVVLGALSVHQFVTIPGLARVLAGVSPRVFLRRTRALMVTGFSTSSSNATLPTTIRTAEEEFGVPREVSGFVLPLGATMNMHGTALFASVVVLFLAQVFGVHLSPGTLVVVLVMSTLTAIGTAGVPGGSIPLIVLILGMVGVPGEGIALILGVDRILDMARTVPNVCGDVLTSLYVTRAEQLAPVAATAPAVEPARVLAE